MAHRTTGRGVGQAFARREAATNSNGQLFTDGRTIWSYGSHWPLAMWGRDGKLYMNADRYSVTTSKHRSFVINGLTSTGAHITERLYSVGPDGGSRWNPERMVEVSCDTLRDMVANPERM